VRRDGDIHRGPRFVASEWCIAHVISVCVFRILILAGRALRRAA
jgi:hypothetical protein